ncbi:eukaryotic translation initiation factor 4G [Coffea eugenioides]|uniref:eukaryotic translation initiation factor 4G n=1 Tax=Coffea eugenioides TaxID=49369 RepID=UPI000F60DE05|nr:eukaryotic translation initiation factor 4G [Coffea eugenioides]
MSHNQSRAERTESSQYRKSGRSNHRNFSGGGGTKGSTGTGGGATGPPPSATSSSHSSNNNYNQNHNQPSIPSSRSFKKHHNVQGGIPRASAPTSGQGVSSDSSTHSAPRAVQNGAHSQQPPHGGSDAPAISATVKATDVATPKATRAPKPPSSNVPPASSDPKHLPMPVTPAKAPAEASRPFPFQFGSISPGLMNGVQIPARTSSAPPNLDEQKREQARHDLVRAAPTTLPIPSIPRQQLPKKDASTVDQSNAAEGHPPSKPKRDVQVSAPSSVSQTQKPPVHSMPGMSMQMPFHQSQVPVQFGGPNPQIQSQAMSATSLPMPMPMPMPLQIGNPSVQQQVFVSGLQPHPMQTQGMLHQGQNLNFTSQMGPQIPPQLGNLGLNMAPQFAQQPAGKFGAPRKTIKITHPETHEELRLDGSPVQRSHPSVPPQSQPISSFTPAHPPNYYPNSYNANSFFLPAPSSLSLSTTHPPPQTQRCYNQVTVKPAISSHGEKDAAPSVSSPRASKGESVKLSRPSQKDTETSSQSSGQQSKTGLEPTPKSVLEASKAAVPSGSGSIQSTASSSLSPGVPVEKSLAAPKSSDGLGPEVAGGLVSTKDQQKKVDERSTAAAVLTHQEPELVEVKTTTSATGVDLENPKETLSTASITESDSFDLKHEESKVSDSSKICVVKTLEDSQPKVEIRGEKEQGEVKSSEGSERDISSLETSLESIALEPAKVAGHIESSTVRGVARSSEFTAQESPPDVLGKLDESATCQVENDSGTDNSVTSSSVLDGEVSHSATGVTTQDNNVSSLGGCSLGRPANMDTDDTVVTTSAIIDESLPVVDPFSEEILKHDEDGPEDKSVGSVSLSASGIKDKCSFEPNVAKNTAPRGKKKRKELFKKLDSSGPTSDLYLAYKGPEEKKEIAASAETMENASSSILERMSSDVSQKDVSKENSGQSKVEPEDWEDAADISTPKLETSEIRKQVNESGEDGSGVMTKKYSRDFLLKFAEQCTDLPEGFEFVPDIAEALIASNASVSRESYSSSGRIVDRPNMAARLDRRGSGLGEEDKWNKLPGPLMSGRDMRMDISYGPNMAMYRPGPVGNHGVLRNPRMQSPLQYPIGMLPGQMQSFVPQVGVPRNSPDSERWQRGTAFQKGLMPSPQTPLQVMHKADRKYEVGKVTDEEQAKQRQLKGILNKLTPQNFEKLFEQVKQVNIDNAVTLGGVISQIFDKALMEPTFCEMYANFCYHLAAELPDLTVVNEKVTFKRLLLNKCQEEFERGEREQEEANRADLEGEAQQSSEEREEKKLRARRRMLGNIRLIGELYKKRMLTERIMHECIQKLLGQYQNPEEEDVEALCKLMSTIGEMIDHAKAKEHMDAYFEMIGELSRNMRLSSRVRFMLRDAIDLRKNKWQQRRKVEGPKKIEEVHRDAAQERQAQARGLARAPSLGSSVRRGQTIDFSPRGTNVLASPSSQMGGFRPMPPQLRGYGAQDVRMEDRPFESRTMPVLPQRPLGDDSITLGPQGGLARGMSFRGQSASPGIQLSDVPSTGDSRRVGPGLNGYPVADRTAYASREDPMPRYTPDRFSGASSYDQSSTQERNMAYGNRDVWSTDRGSDRSLPTSPPGRGGGGALTQNVSSDKVWPEERLKDMSMSAIKEFYSAKDENEVALCIKDLNNPSFYPSMISLWVTDSFERKDMERDLLAKLLITLTKHRDGIISQDHLTKGFDSVLMTLEDAVNDAPRAAEFLGRFFAKVVLENVISFNEVGRLIYEGGEEQGRLVEIGLAAEVLGTILEIIASERGDSVLNEIRSSSNLRLENFRPPSSNKTWRLDKFI